MTGVLIKGQYGEKQREGHLEMEAEMGEIRWQGKSAQRGDHKNPADGWGTGVSQSLQKEETLLLS